MPRKLTEEDKMLLDKLGSMEATRKRSSTKSAKDERIVAGFEEIQRFVDQHGCAPSHEGSNDTFERILATRLDRIRASEEYQNLVRTLDRHGLLYEAATGLEGEEMTDDELLADLGISSYASEIENLRFVRSTSERKATESVASRRKCKDFDIFKSLFDAVQNELDAGIRETRPFEIKSEIEKGRFFVVGGLKAYVAEKSKPFRTDHGVTDARLRIVFDNGTESNLLMRSLHRALNKDPAGRRITDSKSGPLFSEDVDESDRNTGTVYVLRSKSSNPIVAENRDIIHKIGVTSGCVKRRVAGANLQPTFLMANVEIVATYNLYNIDRGRFERLIHKIFANAKIDIKVKDRFGRYVVPKEWFFVPFDVIDQAIKKIMDNTISSYVYDRSSAKLIRRNDGD